MKLVMPIPLPPPRDTRYDYTSGSIYAIKVVQFMWRKKKLIFIKNSYDIKIIKVLKIEYTIIVIKNSCVL